MPAAHPDTAARVKALLADHFCINVHAIRPELSLADDLDADSLDTVEIAQAIEIEFQIDQDATTAALDRAPGPRVADLIRFVEASLAARRGA